MSAPSLSDAQRVVVKIGSALLVDPDTATLREDWLASVCADIAALRSRGTAVVVVSSGAIALARRQLGLVGARLRLDQKQAAASIGQIRLASAWSTALQAHGLIAGQLLLTPEDTEDRGRHLNARATLNTLLSLGGVPVINENDAIATTEMRFGDNDRLAARVAQMIGADQLVLLSDIDGLYTADPRRDPDAAHLPLIDTVDARIMAMGGAPPAGYSSGGMHTKLLAAQIATRSGAHMAIASGLSPHPLRALSEGGRCSWFLAQTDTGSARKRWIGAHVSVRGTVWIDAGAVTALRRGGSLLPAGVVSVEGRFERGDLVSVRGPDNEEIARGLSEYGAQDAERILGLHSDEIATILGFAGGDALIHRDDLVLHTA
ncbi:glutamate 5-kinase [Tanticharoenia sakaeratensis]|uniref:Glutamate 5-kinase n=1 Tax=Tanticharoenia sakaeratensis NBRC 103193 TaxID=1231623 RepID=A0A0D6MNY0_9PROT|nr:glutamate 5-kinase [Tanticharoenia sakaeratensis]GAN55120.1 gamma-glutamyl kinase [Tanticharoenia sakaeratensis NBRC 103193]GBQ20274.1 gamma-glutamyl kinase [Tanticharoenia sakaeratensis NBRC 103193]